jgi:hypothetical protein
MRMNVRGSLVGAVVDVRIDGNRGRKDIERHTPFHFSILPENIKGASLM